MPAVMRAHHVFTWVVLVAITTVGMVTAEPADGNFGILIDAGSSSSKVKLYKWHKPVSFDSVPVVDLVNHTKIKPALSSFSDNLEGLGDYFDLTFKWAKELVPASEHKKTPLVLMATAGMRFESADVTKRLMDAVREVLGGSRNPFQKVPQKDVSVLSGEEEAAYSWIAANYLKGFFDGTKHDREAVGVVEMGGGSTQIAFIPDVPMYDGEFQVMMAGKRYNLYVHSYLHLGASAFNTEIVQRLVNGDSTPSITDPCMLKGDQKSVTLDDGRMVDVQGGGSAQACTDIVTELLKPAQGIYCQPKPCVIRRIYQPSIGNTSFYATGAFTYTPKNLDAVRQDGTLSIELMKEGAKKHCSLTVEEAQAAREGRKKYVSVDCMMGNYVPQLLQNYGFRLDTRKITLSSLVGNKRIDWAMGAMLVKLSDKFSASKGSYGVTCPPKTGSSARTNSPDNRTIILASLLTFWFVTIRALK